MSNIDHPRFRVVYFRDGDLVGFDLPQRFQVDEGLLSFPDLHGEQEYTEAGVRDVRSHLISAIVRVGYPGYTIPTESEALALAVLRQAKEA